MGPEFCDACGVSLDFQTLQEFDDLKKQSFKLVNIGTEVVVLAGNPKKGEELSLRHGRVYDRGGQYISYMTPDGEKYETDSSKIVAL